MTTGGFQILVVMYNSVDWIGPCIDAAKQLEYPNRSIWILDNDSRDDSAQYVEQSYRGIDLVRSDYNRGFAGGNNYLASLETDSEFILLLNPDTEIYPDCLAQLLAAFVQNPRLGIAGCKIVGEDESEIQHLGGTLAGNALPAHAGEGERDEGQYAGLIECEYAQGAALAVRRDLWDELGGLDEGFNPAYFEDADLCKRARDAGWQVAVVADAVVVHHQDPVRQVHSRAFLELLFRGRARYLVKHYSASDWILRYLPAELRWLASKASKRYRRIAVRTLWEAWTGTASSFDPSKDGGDG